MFGVTFGPIDRIYVDANRFLSAGRHAFGVDCGHNGRGGGDGDDDEDDNSGVDHGSDHGDCGAILISGGDGDRAEFDIEDEVIMVITVVMVT